jgi:transposase-like protein
MSKPLTIAQFFKQYPDDETCLAHLFEIRFGQGFECPKCERPSKWFRIKAERAYSCQWCGHHLHPTVGTPFEQTRTPLQYWFYAMYLFTTTRHGVPAKELQRQLGVTYKTAWRMGHEIRKHMANVDGDHPIGGIGEVVEIDETIVGGSVSGKGSGYMGNKTIVMGMMERDGEIVTKVVTARHKAAMREVILENVLLGSTISTDTMGGYKDIDQSGYRHVKVNHNRGQYVDRVTGASVNGLESYWSQLKRGINGTHVSVSGKHLEKYAKEFEFRFNRRDRSETMFAELLSSFRPLSEDHD